MKRLFHLTMPQVWAGLLSLLMVGCGAPDEQHTPQNTSPTPASVHLLPLTEQVNPFIGTGGHGHTFPGATLPFGMVQLSPDTRLEGWDGCSGYHFTDSIVYGFSHTHLSGTGVSDYGDFLFMPMTGAPTFENGFATSPEQGYAARFSKESEVASPGFYSVKLKDYNIDVSLTATERCGLHQYAAPAGEDLHVIVDLVHRDPVKESALRIVDDRHIEGFRFSNAWATDQQIYFAAEFSRPFYTQEMLGELSTAKDVASGKRVKGRFTFAPAGDSALLIKVGLSPVSIEGAISNLKAELPGWNFKEVQQQAEQAWNQQLNKIVVEGGTETQRRIFYSALYHTSLAPNLFMDVDGSYRGMDAQSHTVQNGRQYTVFSLWDTFRATHPLFTLIEQKRTTEFIETFLRQYKEGGILPIWELAGNYTGCMIGYHAIPVIADAYMKGIRDFDATLALEAMQHSADQQHLGLQYYQDQGFIGAGDEAESVSKTLEYAYDDWCIAIMAREMGRSDVYEKYIRRAQFYVNLFDPATGFFRAKMNGGWQEPFDPREVNFNFTEANAWQYSLFVPQDIAGLTALMGGKAALVTHLDSLFSASSATTGRDQVDITGLIGQYAHGNEPSHHMAYLYSFAGASEKTQQRVRQILAEMYHDAPDGLSGNEDCGQMSAWYVLSAMGFYPVTPGTDIYVIGAPIFPKTELKLENGNTFRILAPNVSDENIYIQRAELNGKLLGRQFLRQADFVAGGELRLVMGASPNADWAGPNATLPETKIDSDVAIAPVPFFVAASETFTDSLRVSLESVDPKAVIHYSTDGSLPSATAPVFKEPIWVTNTTTVRAIAVRPDGTTSFPTQATYHRTEAGRSISLKSTYANQYAAGGDRALIDGLQGGPNFRTGRWQGYREDLEAVVDLGQVKGVRSIRMGFLQDIRSWIWFPPELEVAVSTDGRKWEANRRVKPQAPDTQYGAMIERFEVLYPSAQQVRYVRVRAKNYGKCPEWHLGAGGTTWIFADEIVIGE